VHRLWIFDGHLCICKYLTVSTSSPSHKTNSLATWTVLFLISLLLHAQDNFVFGPNVKVNDDPGGQAYHTVYSSGGHAIAARGDTVYVAYRGDQTDSSHVYFSKSTDGGQTWSPGLRVNYPNQGIIQSLAVDAGGDIFIAYTHVDSNSQRDVHCTRSTDGGTSFSYPVMVNDDGTNYWTQQAPAIAVDTSGEEVFLAWMDARDGNTSQWDIYFSRSMDGGMTFEPNVRVDDTGTDSSLQRWPGIAVDRAGENVYVAWQDDRNSSTSWDMDIYFSRSTDAGLSFLPNVLVNDTATTGSSHQWEPTIAVDTLGRIFIAWRDERQTNHGCFFSRSDDGGMSFGNNVKVSDGGDLNIDHPSIAVDDSDGVYVVWGDDIRLGSTAGDRIYFAFSDCAGDSFLPNVRVDDLPVNSPYRLWTPTLTINEDKKVFVAWMDDRLNYLNCFDIYYASGVYVGIEEYSDARPVSRVLQCYPNPFAKSIRFSIPDAGYWIQDVSVSIYNTVGQLVRSFNLESAVIWGGTDKNGKQVPCGIYFVEATVGDSKQVIKVVKIQ